MWYKDFREIILNDKLDKYDEFVGKSFKAYAMHTCFVIFFERENKAEERVRRG